MESIRYWGTLYTTSARDYYVFEVKKGSYEEDEEREKQGREGGGGGGGGGEGGVEGVWEGRELLGSGANEYAYYVTQDLHTPTPTFTQLPSTTPRFINDARATRRLLTGDLKAPVGGFPRFAGVEADLVRAQIARITQGTVVVPRGAWKEEEGEVVIENEDWRGPSPGQRVEWVHVRGHLRREGRVEAAAEEEEEEGEGGEEDERRKAQRAAAKAAAYEAKRPLLAAVAGGAFTHRMHAGYEVGRVVEVKVGGGEEEEGGLGVGRGGGSALVSSCWSLLWPGAVSVVRGKEYGSVYIGWGLKAGAGRVDRLPPRQSEWVGELREGVEVLATEEEAQKEREEEEEKKKEEGEKKAGEEEDDELPADEEAKEEED